MKALTKQNAFVKFISLAGLLYLALYLLHTFIVKKYTYYDQKFIGSIVRASEWVLNALGYKTGTSLQDLDMQVVYTCRNHPHSYLKHSPHCGAGHYCVSFSSRNTAV